MVVESEEEERGVEGQDSSEQVEEEAEDDEDDDQKVVEEEEVEEGGDVSKDKGKGKMSAEDRMARLKELRSRMVKFFIHIIYSEPSLYLVLLAS